MEKSSLEENPQDPVTSRRVESTESDQALEETEFTARAQV